MKITLIHQGLCIFSELVTKCIIIYASLSLPQFSFSKRFSERAGCHLIQGLKGDSKGLGDKTWQTQRLILEFVEY